MVVVITTTKSEGIIMIEKLEQIGFTKYEAKAYLALLEGGDLNGYELSKAASIPKPNAYAILNTMTEKGYVYKIEGKSIRYRAREFKEITEKITEDMKRNLDYLEQNLPNKIVTDDNFLTVIGDDNIINCAKKMISEARENILIDVWEKDYEEIKEALESAKSRDVSVVLVVMEGNVENNKFDYVYNHPLSGDIDNSRDLNIVCDKSVGMSGVVGGSKAKAVVSSNKSFVNVIFEAISHDVLLREALLLCGDREIEGLRDMERLFYS